MTVHYADDSVALHHGDALEVARTLGPGSADCIVTSPPYFGLRDYGVSGQYGLEASPAEYVETMRALFSELRRVLADDGTLWLNIGDSYAAKPAGSRGKASAFRSRGVADQQGGGGQVPGLPDKNLIGIPWRVAFALQDDGWLLRNAIVWNKPNAMPESVTDRLSTRYEHVFLFAKSSKYWFDLDSIRDQHVHAIAGTKGPGGGWADGQSRGVPASGHRNLAGHENGKNPGDVWSITTRPFSDAHFAVMPVALAERCVQAGCKSGGTVLDPFSGSGTTGLAASRHGRKYVGIDLSAEYLDLSLRTRLQEPGLDFGGVA